MRHRHAPRPTGRKVAALQAAAHCLGLLCLAGCAAPTGQGVVGQTLEWLGVKAPEPPDASQARAPARPRRVAVRLHAGETLNTDTQRRSLSVVVRVYKLKQVARFLAAPYGAFADETSERLAFGSDVVEVRELVLAPGQRHEVMETLPDGATHIAVAALFRAPAMGRWRFAFAAPAAERTGVTLGLHGCAMSVAAGAPEQAAPESLRLAGVVCD